MKLPFLRGIIFCGLAVALFLLANAFYEKSDYYRGIEGLFRYEDVPENLQVVNFGSSHAMCGIDYANFPQLRTFNFSLNSQNLYCDYLLMRSYQKHLSRGCVVILPVSYYSLYAPVDVDSMKDVLPRYYRILDLDNLRELPGFNIKDMFLYRYFPILSAQRAVTMTFAPTHELTYMPPGGLMAKATAEEYGRKRAYFHFQERDEHKVVPEQLDSLRNMLALCRQNGWKPVIVTLPVTVYYSKWFSDQALAAFHQTILSLVKEYPEAMYMDYSRDQRFADNIQLFKDSDHLNQPGRLAFTQILLQDCWQAGLFGR